MVALAGADGERRRGSRLSGKTSATEEQRHEGKGKDEGRFHARAAVGVPVFFRFVFFCDDFRSFSFVYIFLFRQVLGDFPEEKD
jgi:hypothetical protein